MKAALTVLITDSNTPNVLVIPYSEAYRTLVLI